MRLFHAARFALAVLTVVVPSLAAWAAATPKIVISGNEAKVTVGTRTGTVTFANAEAKVVDNELVLVYSNATAVASGGSLQVGDMSNKVWAKARVLAVAGGGGGGCMTTRTYGGGGGGGAGGMVEAEDLIFDGDYTYKVAVGAGGAGSKTTRVAGTNGGNSTVTRNGVDMITPAVGGGGGGAFGPGNAGGSGGGGSRKSTAAQPVAEGVAGQGYAGGSCSHNNVGAGGGGAGGAGGDTVSNSKAGDGGDGRESDITGAKVVYAGGGGGSVVNSSTSKSPGGLGGAGGGGAGAGIATDGTVQPAENGRDGFGGGGGGGAERASSTNPAGNGGSGVVVVRLSGFIVGAIEVPTPVARVYNGAEQEACDEFDDWAYTLGGTWKATNADVYTFTATLPESSPYVWADGGKGTRTVVWSIRPMSVKVPPVKNEYKYEPYAKFDNTEQTAVASVDAEKTNGGVDADGICWTNGFAYCKLTDFKGTDAGKRELTAALVADRESTPNVTNFVWTTGSTADVTAAWEIAPADNAIVGLQAPNYQTAGTSVGPTISTWTWKSVAARYPGTPDDVVFTYHKGVRKPTDDADYDLTEPPLEPGVYWVHAYVCKDSKHTPGNWVAAHAYARFTVWRHPSELLTDYVDIEIGSTDARTLPDLPVLVRLSEETLPGFSYDRAGMDGSSIRFVQLPRSDDSKLLDADRDKSNDQLLPYEIEKWNPYGESLVWVKVNPTGKTVATGKFRLYWHPHGESPMEDYKPSDVWTDYVGVWHMGEEARSDSAAKTKALDSTINGLDARPDGGDNGSTARMVSSEDGIVGRARVIESVNSGKWGNHLVVPNGDALKLGDTFVFSTWVKVDGYDSWPILVSRKAANETGKGWAIEHSAEDRKQIVLRGNDNNYWTKSVWTRNEDVTNTYAQIVIAFNGKTAQVWANGVDKGSSAVTSASAVSDTDLDLFLGGGFSATGTREYSLRGKMDETRLKKGTTTTARVKAEYDMVMDAEFCKFGLVNRPSAVTADAREWVDSWDVEPTLKHYWDVNNVSSIQNTIENGRGRLRSTGLSTSLRPRTSPTSRSITWTCRKMPEGLEMGKVAPSEEGAYVITYTGNPGTDEYGMSFGFVDGTRSLELEIIGDRPTPIVDPAGGTASGRILLANDDTNETAPVLGQSLWNWTAADGGTLVLSNDVRRLWKLTDVTIGNLFAPDGTLAENLNTLPWSGTSKNALDETLYDQPLQPTQVGMLVMRNANFASIESSIYTNGIGTIYFDIVNASLDAVPGSFGLEVATTEDPIDTTGAGWTTRTMNPIPIVANRRLQAKPATEMLDDLLVVTNGGNVATFSYYRVYVKVDTQRPTRFRIRRTATFREEDSLVADRDDVRGWILIDNVIASFAPPLPTLMPCGALDETRTGKAILGVETAFTEEYPSIRDDFRGRVTLAGGDVGCVTAVRLNYRWRYLNAAFDPIKAGARDPWNMAYFDLPAGARELVTKDAVAFRREVGDLEFYYDMTAVVPYYTYVDYSGLNLGVPSSASEKLNPSEPYTLRAPDVPTAAGGRDWFVRLREHTSKDRGWTVIAKPADDAEAPEQRFAMELVSTNTWRGLMATSPATGYTNGTLLVRFEQQRPENPGATNLTFATTPWTAGDGTATLPKSLTLTVAKSTNDWSRVPCEGVTGYLMFQYDTSTRTLSITRADYQNFNKWDDANTADDTFVGTSTLDEKKSGVSPKIRDWVEPFTGWTDMPTARPELWSESFTAASLNTYPVGRPFTEFQTLNNWKAGYGQWVAGRYCDNVGTNAALQLKGCGEGYVEYLRGPINPRGLESLNYTARLAQDFTANDVAYNFQCLNSSMKNYTFVVQAAMTTNTVDDIKGTGAQLSLIGYYRPNKGFYEMRVERTDDNAYQASFYKWAPVNRVMTPRLLVTVVDNKYTYDKIKANGRNLPSYFFSLEKRGNGVVLLGGAGGPCVAPGQSPAGEYNAQFVYLDTESPLEYGTFGVASANCPSVFSQPRYYASAQNHDEAGNAGWEDSRPNDHTGGGKWTNKNHTNFLGVLHTGEYAELDDWWSLPIERVAPWYDRTGDWGIRTDVPEQYIVLQRRSREDDPWQTLETNKVSGFSMSATVTRPFNIPEDGVYRFAHAGKEDDLRVDVVLDNLEIRQWAGDNYGGEDAHDYPNFDEGGRWDWWTTNIVFTSGWVHDGCVMLSAKRTKLSVPSSIRSPLMDGRDGRGIGLGLISVDYKDAQENVNLLVQIATNNVQGSASEETLSLNPDVWTTVTNVDFSVLTKEERRTGTCNFYLGLHGVRGLMRIVMDPEVVASVADETDPTRYGEIDIVRVVCRDEPSLDQSSWWGWNIRTIGYAGVRSLWDNGKRSYLPDGHTPGDRGLSLALNCSVTEAIREDDADTYRQHMPFVQTPTFATNIVGEVTFRARMFATDATAQKAELRVYGATKGGPEIPEKAWTELEHFVISNTTYETYRFRSPSTAYHAFRFGVTGVKGVSNDARGPDPTEGDVPVRVLLDEIVVSEALYPTVGFRYCYPVRTGLVENTKAPAVIEGTGGAFEANPDEQPLVGENWALQAEIEPKQLPEEIDFETPGREPRVFVQWFRGRRPWGYESWKATSKPVELALCEGEKLVFRGSLSAAPQAVVDETTDDSAVFQYMATVVYHDRSGGVRTNNLEATEWRRPEWYNPVDYNATEAGFAGFTILDTIAPRRAWINEVNLYDGKTPDYSYPAETNQYVEIAVPANQPLEGWRLEYVDNSLAETNTLCTFGSAVGNVRGTKMANETNDYVFVVVQSPATRDAKTWVNVKRPDGTPVEIDGTWSDWDGSGGVLNQRLPIALRLVRPTQVVEQEIALQGTNTWAGGRYEEKYSLESYVKKLNAGNPGAHSSYYSVGDEFGEDTVVGLEGRSHGVVENVGRLASEWSKEMHQTPGWCNEGQVVPEEWVIYPNGAMIMITAKLAGGHLLQAVEGEELTDETIKVSAMKGGEGTNFVYVADTWYELASLETNKFALAVGPGVRQPDGRFRYVVNVGKGLSNNVALVATSAPWRKLVDEYGLDENNRYTPAVLDWLEKGETLFGAFKHPGEINLADYRKLNGEKINELSLTDMYWLDMDPTEGDWWFQAGVSEAPMPVDKPQARLRLAVTPPDPEWPPVVSEDKNIRVKVKMQMTNTVSGVCYAPYVLRGVEPGSTSERHHAEQGAGNWNSASFKVTGDLQNGMPMRERWIPLRWFYFLPDRSAPNRSASFDADNTAVVDVWDPFDPQGSGVTSGWENYKGTPVFYSWAIDGRNMPTEVESLKPNATF